MVDCVGINIRNRQDLAIMIATDGDVDRLHRELLDLF